MADYTEFFKFGHGKVTSFLLGVSAAGGGYGGRPPFEATDGTGAGV